jgi:hypothetical protein
MDSPGNPSAKVPHCDSLGSFVLEDGSGVPMVRKALLQGAAVVVRLFCSQLHNNYVALVRMRLQTSKPAIFDTVSSFEYHIPSRLVRSLASERGHA